MASIASLKSALVSGGSRPNQFKIMLDFPTMAGNAGTAKYRGEFLCEATSLPGSSIGVAPVSYRGRQLPLAGDRTFQPWRITVVNDDFGMYNVFEKWMEGIHNVDSVNGDPSPANYMVNAMHVLHLSKDDKVIKHYTFKDVFPIDVSPINLAFDSNDNIERFDVTFQYTNWILGNGTV